MDQETFFDRIRHRLGCGRERAQTVAMVVLQELRDRLPENEAADVVAQLPGALRNLWFEPGRTGKPVDKIHRAELLERVRARVPMHDDLEAVRAVHAVFAALQELLGSPSGLEGEAWDVFSVLPKDLKAMWRAAREEARVRAHTEPPCL